MRVWLFFFPLVHQRSRATFGFLHSATIGRVKEKIPRNAETKKEKKMNNRKRNKSQVTSSTSTHMCLAEKDRIRSVGKKNLLTLKGDGNTSQQKNKPRSNVFLFDCNLLFFWLLFQMLLKNYEQYSSISRPSTVLIVTGLLMAHLKHFGPGQHPPASNPKTWRNASKLADFPVNSSSRKQKLKKGRLYYSERDRRLGSIFYYSNAPSEMKLVKNDYHSASVFVYNSTESYISFTDK